VEPSLTERYYPDPVPGTGDPAPRAPNERPSRTPVPVPRYPRDPVPGVPGVPVPRF